jgi:hypothetical protein
MFSPVASARHFFGFLIELLMVVSFDKLLYLLGDLPIMHLKECGLTVEPFAGLRKKIKSWGLCIYLKSTGQTMGMDHLETVFHPE